MQSYPDKRGRFGEFGGRYVAETLMPALAELESAYRAARGDPAFRAATRLGMFDADLVASLKAADLDGATVSVAAGTAAGWPAPLARAAVLHLMWTGHLVFDMRVRLSGATVLRRRR